MSAVNWGEVLYATRRDRGANAAERLLEVGAQLPIEIEPADKEAAKVAAEFKAQFQLPYVDCFAASAAKRHKATVVTADSDFAALERHLPILFLQGLRG